MKRGLAIASALALACLAVHGGSAFGAEEERAVVVNDADGNLLSLADALGNEVTFVYDESTGEFLATIDQDGVVTDWQHLFAESGDGSEQ